MDDDIDDNVDDDIGEDVDIGCIINNNVQPAEQIDIDEDVLPVVETKFVGCQQNLPHFIVRCADQNNCAINYNTFKL